MIRLIFMEMKKMISKKRVLVFWGLSLFLSYISIREFSIEETYADMFSKSYGMTPFIGLLIFTMVSGSYVIEYSSGMDELIKTSKAGRKNIVMAKGIAGGILSSLVSLSIFLTSVFSGITKMRFEGLNTPLKTLWYFGKSNSDISVIQLILIMCVSIVIGSFFFSQLGLFLSCISKSSTLAFLFGGLIMGVPFVLEGFVRGLGFSRFLGIMPLWVMMSGQMIRYQVPVVISLTGFIITIGLGIGLYKCSEIKFLKEA